MNNRNDKQGYLTALAMAYDLAEKSPMGSTIKGALKEVMHPQSRTRRFHEFYDAPIRTARPDRRFSHMTDERVAFRLHFILSEFREILKDSFGIDMGVSFKYDLYVEDGPSGEIWTDTTFDESQMFTDLHTSLRDTGKRDVIEVADGLGDLNVVVNGFALELGIDMNAVDREIAASNFTKADDNGNPIIGDGTNGPVGKVLKGPNYMKPQLGRVLLVD